MAKNNFLSLGSKGSSVKELQVLLDENGYHVEADGIYGPNTESAVKAYQKANGLKLDGLAGEETMGSLKSGSGKPTLKDTLASEGKLVTMDDVKAPSTSGSDPDTGRDVPMVVIPSTGGTGTFWLITIGTLLAIGFAVFLITHKKMSVYTD